MSLALFLAACSDNSQQVRETFVSWRKSLELLEQQRTERHVPETYVRQMVEAATRTLKQHRNKLQGDRAVNDLDAKIRQLGRGPGTQRNETEANL
jgi:hypothetical protein